MPEETIWFKTRFTGSWLYVALLLVVGHFVFPLFAMLPRSVKRNRGTLAFFASWLLLMHYTDLYWQVMPVFYKAGFGMSWLSPVCLVAVVSTMGLVFWSSFREKPLVPMGDPRLKQCLAFHNA
jgi:cellulose synthase/poly-beta-1,6-N-acetylglucosamine synthase-like glycosyltransferase